MTRPTKDELEYAENADIGRCGCLVPTGEAAPEEGEDDGDE